MKISTYTPVGSASITLPTGRASASTNVNAYGGKTDLSPIDNVMKFATKIQEDKDAQSAFEAMNDYNQQMNDLLYNKDGGLMHLEGSAAQNVGLTYAAAEKKIREDVLSKHKVMMRGADVALNNSLERLNLNNGRNVMLHETKQFEVAKVNTLNSNIDTASKAAQSNYSDYENVKTQADMVAMQARETFKYKGEDVAEKEAKKAQAAIYKSAMGTALQQENFGSFEELLLQGGDYLDAQELNKYKQIAFVKQRSKFESEMAEKALAASGGDMRAAEKWLKEQEGFYSDHNTGKMSDESVARVLREMGGLITEQKRVARGQSRATYAAGTSAIDDMLENGVSFQDALKWARANDTKGTGRLEKLVRSRYKAAGNEGAYYDPRTMRQLLREGTFSDEFDVEDWVAYQGFSDKERKEALKEFNNYYERKGPEWGINWKAIAKDYGYSKMSGLQQAEFDYAIDMAKSELVMSERYGEQDRNINDYDARAAIAKALEKETYHKGGMFGGDERSISKAKLRKLGVNNLWYDEDEDRVIVDRGGTVENMSQEEWEEFAGGALEEE